MLGVFPLATEPVSKGYPPAAVPAALFELIEAADGAGQYLVEIIAYKGGEARSGGLWTLAEGPLATVPTGGGVTVGQVTLRYADRHWMGDPDAAQKANTFYEGRVTSPLVMERNMPLLPEQARRVQRQFGIIEIANGDGQLDSIVQSYAVDGRRVRVLFGPYMGSYSDFRPVADVLGTGWEGDDLSVRLGLRDRSYALDLPLQSELYAGTGGAEGTEELTGKPKPLLFGRCRNVTPTLVDPVNLIYQVHDGAIHALDEVFDRGAALTDSTDDVASYAALVAQSVSAGEFATAKAVGLFKLGATPDGLITADVRGDATPDYADTLDLIALRILDDRAGLDGRFINRPSFAGAATIGGEMGIYISSAEIPTTAQVLDALLASVVGWWGAARDGRVRAGRLTKPEDRTANLTLDQYDILALEPEEPPVPRWRQRVAYKRNWTEQRGEDLAASVTAARRQFLTEPLRAVSAVDTDVRVRHLQALDPDPLPTLFESSVTAQALAADQIALHAPDRRVFRVTLKKLGYLIDLGKIVHITWPRLGLQNGKKFTVIGIVEDGTYDTTTLRVWG